MKNATRTLLLLASLSMMLATYAADMASINYTQSQAKISLEENLAEVLVVQSQADLVGQIDLAEQFDRDELRRRLHETSRAQVKMNIKKQPFTIPVDALTTIN